VTKQSAILNGQQKRDCFSRFHRDRNDKKGFKILNCSYAECSFEQQKQNFVIPAKAGIQNISTISTSGFPTKTFGNDVFLVLRNIST
jgi:hypothetical protein